VIKIQEKGKIRPLAILEKSLLYPDAFSSLGTSETIDEKKSLQ
jgi:hypothetical protein